MIRTSDDDKEEDGGGDGDDDGGDGDVSLNLPPPESYSTSQSAPQGSLENCNKFTLLASFKLLGLTSTYLI